MGTKMCGAAIAGRGRGRGGRPRGRLTPYLTGRPPFAHVRAPTAGRAPGNAPGGPPATGFLKDCSMNVVIVESPAKAKTINKYLGRDFDVIACYGHVRDLPPKDGSVDPDDDFAMKWESRRQGGQAHLRHRRSRQKRRQGHSGDRSGSRGRGHLLAFARILKKKKVAQGQAVERVVFNAVTKDAIIEAMAHPREIDKALVDAYLARRALDYLVGFTLSPVLWRKLPGARSAGRVQSVALRLVCDRELEIEKFVTREYWSLVAHLKTKAGDAFTARLVGADGKKIARLDIGAGAGGRGLQKRARERELHHRSVEAKPVKRHPYAALHHLDAAAGGLAQARLRARADHAASRSASMRASTSAARRPVSSPICEPTASTWRPRPSPRRARSSPRNMASASCRRRRANIR